MFDEPIKSSLISEYIIPAITAGMQYDVVGSNLKAEGLCAKMVSY